MGIKFGKSRQLIITSNIELLGNLSIDYSPFSWLTFSGVIAPRYRTRNNHDFSKSIMTYYEDGSEAGAAYNFTDLKETAYRYYFENYHFFTTINKEWGVHSIKFMCGASNETCDEKYLMGYRRDYLFNTYEVLRAGADNETKDNDGTHDQWALASVFGRFNYVYKNRYLFEANMRYDGSSRFRKDIRWAAFPSFSVGWRISEEKFMKKTREIIDQMKVRTSWGKLGNQNIGGSYYPYVSELALGSISMNKVIYPILALNTMGNPNLKWEETEMLNFGIDINLFNHFSFTGDWYKKTTEGILMKLYISQLIGLNAPYQNAGVVRNTGWEIGANYDNHWGNFMLGIGLNLSDVKNVIIDMKGQTSGTLLRQQEGYPVNSIYGYLSDGLYQSEEEIAQGPTQFGTLRPGDIKYKDIAGGFDEKGNPIPDGQITEADKTIIGNTIPRYTYGINLNMGWRGIKLNVFLQGVGKVDGYLNSHYVIPCVNSSAIKTWQLDYWTEENRNATFPRPSITSTNNIQNSDYWMRSAAYLRLKNLEIGYNFSRNTLNNLGINNVYLYLSCDNLFTITNFWQGYDPEINYNSSASEGVSLGSGAYYPQVKTFSLGINLKF